MFKILVILTCGLCSLAAQPADWEGWMKQGAAALSASHFSQAADAFRMAVKLKPVSVEAHLGLANAYRFQFAPGINTAENSANAEQAEDEFQRVVELDSKHVAALQALGALSVQQAQAISNAEEKSRKLDRAAEWYQKLLAVDARDKEALSSLGVIAWTKVNAVRLAARHELGMKPDDPGPIPDTDLRRQLRSQLESMIDDGITNSEKALQLDAKLDGAMEYLSLLLRERADLEDSENEYNRDIEAADQWARKCAAVRKAKQGK